jgi:hypothetical protein
LLCDLAADAWIGIMIRTFFVAATLVAIAIGTAPVGLADRQYTNCTEAHKAG